MGDTRVRPVLHKACGKVCIPEPEDTFLGVMGDMFRCPECGGEWTRYDYINALQYELRMRALDELAQMSQDLGCYEDEPPDGA